MKPVTWQAVTTFPSAKHVCARTHRGVVIPAAIALAAILAFGCSKGSGGGDGAGKGKGRGAGGDAPVPVSVAEVTQADVPVTVGTFGTVEPYASVAVKSQVNGALSEVHVKEGQDVKAGDLLFVIDPRPYQAALGVAEANLEKDTAQAALAQSELARSEDLLKSGIGAASDYDKDKAAAASANASVSGDREAIETAKLNLAYCYINAPIDGRTGALFVDRGNTVKANDVPIITINQVRPIYVVFSLPEQELPRIREYSAARALDVEAAVRGGENRPARGKLTFIDNAVSSDTGTIVLKATFDNSDERLWPGQHVEVTLFLTTVEGAVVAPAPAVQDGQSGKYAFVVKSDMTVENRAVVAGDSFGDKVIIEKGLKLGETVVIEGHLKLVPGAKIAVKAPIAERGDSAVSIPSTDTAADTSGKATKK